MGTIAEKLNYLNDTKGLFKNRINSLGGEITEQTTFRNYITWLDKFYNEVSDKTDMAENGIVGDTEQETTTGKNLLPNIITSQTVNGITFTKNNDGTVLVNGIATALVTVYVIGNNVLSLSPGTYTLSGCPLNGSDNTYRLDINDGSAYRDFGYGRTFTLEETLNITNVRIRITSGTTVNNLLFKPMIEQSSTVTNYEPFTNGPSPNPDFPQEIKNRSGDLSYKVTGKNLAVAQNYNRGSVNGVTWSMQGSTITANGTATDATQSMLISYALSSGHTFKLSAGTYTLSGGKTITVELLKKTGDTTATLLGSSYNNNTFTFTITEEIEVFYRGSISNGTTVNETVYVMLEKGEQVTSYEPYISRTFPINLKSKNLFDKDNANILIANLTYPKILSSSNAKMLYISITGGETYTISKIASKRFRIATTIDTPAININTEQFYVGDDDTTYTITTNSTANYLCVYYYLNGTDTLTEQEILNSIQIEENDHATSYESPYDIQLCKQDTYQDFIKRSTGKNLFGDSLELGGINSTTGANTQNNTTIRNIGYINVKENTTYTITTNAKDTNSAIALRFYEENETFLSSGDTKVSPNTFTTPSNCYKLRIVITGETDILTNVQLEIGDTATEYEPYGHQFYLHKDIYKDTYNGSESYWYSASQSISSYYKQVSYAKITGVNNFYCDKFSYKGNAQSTELGYAMSFNANSQYNRYMYIQVPSDVVGINDVEAFKTWLGTHNVSVQYPLANPTTEVISEEKYPVLFKQLSDIQDYLTSYKINKEFILGYDEPSVEY